MTVLESSRLILRPLTLDDLDDLAAIYADPEVMRFFPGTRTRQETLAGIEKSLAKYEKLGFHLWATIHKDDGQFIGRCGLLPQVIDGVHEVEVAYMIAKAYWGRGLGTEAARGIRDYGFAKLDVSRLVSIIDPRNIASIRVAEKNGMSYVKRIIHKGFEDSLYAIEKPSRTPDKNAGIPKRCS